jgi:predicted transcriptional regulator
VVNADDDMVDRLRRIALEVDGPPGLMRESALAALSLRCLDGELVRLVSDSAVDAGMQVRGADEPVRLLSFETAEVSIELQVREVDGRMAVRGLVAGVVGEVRAETPQGSRTVPVDADGWFHVDDLPPEVFRLHARALDGTAVTTSWVTG